MKFVTFKKSPVGLFFLQIIYRYRNFAVILDKQKQWEKIRKKNIN